MHYYVLVFSIVFCMSESLLGSEKRLKTELSHEESISLETMYTKKPWNIIKEYHKENAISFDVTMDISEGCPLSLAMRMGKIDIAHALLDEMNVDVTYTKIYTRLTPLHELAQYFPYNATIKDGFLYLINRYRDLLKKLVDRGCDINAMTSYSETPLAMLLKWRDGYRDSDVFIESGALLLVKEDNRRWNAFDAINKELTDIYSEYRKLYRHYFKFSRDLELLEKKAKSLLYPKCKYDYKNYCKAFITTTLIFKELKSKKKLMMPRVLINYISNFIAQDPVKHIEEALDDAGETLSSQSKKIEGLYEGRFNYMCSVDWRSAWDDYKRGNRDRFNLIVQALEWTR